MTVHFVYIKGDSISTPAAITNEVAARLALRFALKVYDWAERITIHPEPGDVLIGHPSLDDDTVFNTSFYQPGWARRIVFSPFAHAMLEYNGYTDPFAVEAELYLAICGKYWFDTNESSKTSHWHYKMVHCDLAVNREHFPQIKHSFNPPGRRRFLYIGRPGACKGTDYLAALAQANPTVDFGWCGQGHIPSPRITAYGLQDFRTTEAKQLVANYDFLITCGRSDANPTTILESAAWGLIPVATLQSGYCGDDWLVNIPLDDVTGASAVLRRLNECPEVELLRRQAAGFHQLDRHYNWDRVTQQICDVIEMPVPNEPTDPTWHARKQTNQAYIRRVLLYSRMKKNIEWASRLPLRAARKSLRAVGLIPPFTPGGKK